MSEPQVEDTSAGQLKSPPGEGSPIPREGEEVIGDLRESFEQAVEENKLLTPADLALIEAGRTIASQIDFAKANFTGQDLTKALYLTPHLINILREMFATPASRRGAGIKDEEAADNKLAEVRNIRGRRAPTKKRFTA